MPRLWNETIEGHRRDVRAAILDATEHLVTDHGLTSVTMSGIAETTGIGRATLYKYFSDVEAVLVAWHERQVSRHLAHFTAVANQPAEPVERLRAVLEAYAFMTHQHQRSELAALLHRGEEVDKAHRQLAEFVRALLTEAAQVGGIRADVPTDELATYCLHALTAASALPSEAAVSRLVAVTLEGLHAGD